MADTPGASAADPPETRIIADEHRGDIRPLRLFVYWLGVVISLWHLWVNTIAPADLTVGGAIHFGGIAILCALSVPLLSGRGAKGRLALAADILLALAAAGAALYILLNEDAVASRGYAYETGDWIAAIIAIATCVEFARRTTGLIIPVLVLLSLTYLTVWGPAIDGVFKFAGLSWETVLRKSIYGDEGMFGIIANISFTVVYMFILFGAFLVRSGAAEAIIDLSRALVGRVAGGQGFVAVFSSGLMGTISGSAAANTSSTGIITIPLMKRGGFPPRFAAAVEASASTGGQLMPPIMGAGVFVMASITQISYTDIIAVAFLPAVMYFLTVAIWVRIEARKLDLKPEVELPAIWPILKSGGLTFIVPLTLLIGLLVAGFTPTYAAPFAILSVIVTSWLTPNKMGPRAILDALALGARNMILVGILLVVVGLIVNVMATAGIGPTLSQMIKTWAGGNLLIALALIALASLVLGMGLPVTASYIVLGTISAPALNDLLLQTEIVSMIAEGNVPQTAMAFLMLAVPDAVAQLGQPMSLEAAQGIVDRVGPDIYPAFQDAMKGGLDPVVLTTALLSAHMIIFWLSQDSNVTPPVCLTAFIAAAIAGTKPMATGFTAWRVAKGLYIVPVLFAYTPFLSGDFWLALEIFVFGMLGIYALAGAVEGHLEHPVAWTMRPVLVVLGVVLLIPLDRVWELGAGAVFLIFLVVHHLMHRAPRTLPS